MRKAARQYLKAMLYVNKAVCKSLDKGIDPMLLRKALRKAAADLEQGRMPQGLTFVNPDEYREFMVE